jgi:hypothetical protein
MSASEQELFTLVDNARTQHGCASLQRDSNLSHGAQSDAAQRAANGDLTGSDSSMAATGDKGMTTAKAAFDRLMSNNSGTVLNCGLDELGVGHRQAKYCSSSLLGLCLGTSNRDSWVVDFQ